MEPRELDAALAERLFPWSNETRLCRLAWSWIVSTGYPFELKDGSRIFCPAGSTLPQPEDTVDWNSRYALYIGRHLLHEGKITTDDVKNVKTNRPGLSTAGAGMLKVLEAMDARGLHIIVSNYRSGDARHWHVTVFDDMDGDTLLDQDRGHADTLPRAVALAALAAIQLG